jgi:hypothetical protein
VEGRREKIITKGLILGLHSQIGWLEKRMNNYLILMLCLYYGVIKN